MLRRSALRLAALTALVSAVATPHGTPAPVMAEAAPAAVRPLPFFYDLYTFRGQAGTAVVAAFAVPAGELEREPIERGVRYRFDVSFVLADTARRVVKARHDSVHVDVPRPLPREHLLYTSVEMQAPPSTSTVQRVIMFNVTEPGIGQLYTTPFPVPDYSGSGLMLSDIALGQPDAAAGWRRGAVTLALLPNGRFPASAFEVYYEIYNLDRSVPYATELVVEDVGDAGAPRRIIRTAFTDEAVHAADGYVAELRRVETSLPRGRYRITATVTNLETGATASRSRTFEVHAGVSGATMLPALPVRSASSD